MEGQDGKGRSRASSTSSLGREVRCGCQYFQSDSLLPERRAMMMRPSSRNAHPVTTSGACEHEYEPIGPLIPRTLAPVTTTAPVVRIIDTDVVPVADSDDSIDVKGRFTPGPVLDDDDLIVPLDGQIEDSAMEARELGSGDTSDDLELETAQQLQDRIEARFLSTATPGSESRTDGEVNTSQVDSSVMEELPLRRGARGLPQRLRSQAGKLRSRIRGIQRPNFTFPIERNKSSKARSSDRSKSSEKTKSSEKSKSSKAESRKGKPSRIERIRSSLPDRPKFSLPERPKFRLPDKSKFHLPERPKINLPNLPKLPSRASFHLPNIPGRRRAPSLGEQQRQHSGESTAGSRRNIFDFSTVPRLFDRKSKEHGEYATSSPKESRAQSSESATLPRTKKSKTSFGSRWTARFTDIKFDSEEQMEKPWKHPTSEEPRRSLRPQESIEDSEPIPWIEEHRASIQAEELPYDESEKQREEFDEVSVPKLSKIIHRDSEESYEPEPPQIDPRLYGDQDVNRMDREEFERETYRVSFEPVDPRKLHKKRVPSEEEGDYEDEGEVVEEEELEGEVEHYSSEPEDESARSDREQQASSGSSCDRRRRGVIEEIDSDEFFLRAKGISQDDMSVGKYLTSEIRDALRAPGNALAHEVTVVESMQMEPPQRPARKRNLRKRKEQSLESVEAIPPSRPKRILRRSADSNFGSNSLDRSDSISGSRHRIVYHAESAPLDLSRVEPLDDIIVVKPVRRKSRSSLRSASLVPSEPIPEVSPEVSPPPVPQRRKRRARQINKEINGIEAINGHDVVIETWHIQEIVRPKSEPPLKPARVPSREVMDIITRIEDDYIEPALKAESEPPPIPPKRRSRSRGTSILQDDDGTSRGAESLQDIAYVDDEEEEEENERLTQTNDNDTDSRGDFPGYAVIEKREKPPRPPPPRRRRGKFATTPRASPGPPSRPQRAYSTLRPRSPTPPEVDLSTPYVEIDAENIGRIEDLEDGEHRDLMSGQVLMKMAGRPLPAPPRPPRTKEREKTPHEHIEDLPTYASSTQTDPLPDDMVIEEEIMQARVIITPSRSGSQILVSTERIPSPHQFRAQTSSQEEISALKRDFLREAASRSEPELATTRTRESPEGDSEIPQIPPLPASHMPSAPAATQEAPPQRPPRARSQSLSAPRDDTSDARIAAIEELEERLTALLTSETFKIANLEVEDLRVDKLSVSALEAHKIAVSELDAIVLSASEITTTGDSTDEINPSLLKELVAIRSQLEAVAASHSQPPSESPSKTESTVIEVKESPKESSKLAQLQPEVLSKTTETRALYSTQVSEHSPIREHQQIQSEESTKELTPPVSRPSSRASSPARTGLTGAVLSRETASPIKSLPPVISVTPDIVDTSAPADTPSVVHKKFESSEIKPQRATISYSPETSPDSPERPSSPISQQFIAFQTSQIPPQFFALASPVAQTPVPNAGIDEPGVLDMSQQLLRALRLAGKRAMRHFVGYVVSRLSQDESEAKIREIELTLCALLLIIAGLLIVCFAGPRTITHHHHWDYFNPPRL